MISANVVGGTHAGWRRVKGQVEHRCECGSFISRERWIRGQRSCFLCRHFVVDREAA